MLTLRILSPLLGLPKLKCPVILPLAFFRLTVKSNLPLEGR
jgi:hypothetical protein